MLSGLDWVIDSPNGNNFIAGISLGYNTTHIRFTNGLPSQTIDGATLVPYLAATMGKVSANVIGKLDFFDYNASPGASVNSTKLTNYTVASEVFYRLFENIGATESMVLSPEVGLQYSYTHFGDGAAAMELQDGHTVRVEAGLSLTDSWRTRAAILRTATTGKIFTNVVNTGTSLPLDAHDFIRENDQGKLGGQIDVSVKVDFLNGFSSELGANVHTGSDLIGAGGRGEIKYQW